MKNNKVCLIIDPSTAFLRSKTQDIFKEWGFTRDRVKEIDEWVQIPKNPSLFGELLMTHLDLTNKNSIKKFVDVITQRKLKEFFASDWYGNGIIITATTSVGTKKIEKLVLDSGGYIIKKEKAEKRKDELIKNLSLTREVKTAVLDFVGEDYDLMLSFVNSIKKETKEKQKTLSVVEAFSYFPPRPGSVPPWDYLNILLNGNTSKSIDLFKRTLINTNILVPLVFLVKKAQLIYRIRMAVEDGIRNDKEIALAIGATPGWEIINTAKVAKKLSVRNVEIIAKIALTLESDLKGGSKVNGETLFTIALTQIGMLLGNRS